MGSPVQILSWLAMKIHKPVYASCILRFLPPQKYKPKLNSNVLQRYGIVAQRNLGSDLPPGNIIGKESVSSEWVQEINRPELLLSFREMATFAFTGRDANNVFCIFMAQDTSVQVVRP